MSVSNFRPGNVTATLSTLPLEIFDIVMSNLEDKTLFMLRLVCREFYHRAMERLQTYFRHLPTVFTRRNLRRASKLARCPTFQSFGELLSVNMTVDGRVLASPFEPGWERDRFGYFVNPENLYEIRALRNITYNLPNYRRFKLLYYISKDKTEDDWRQVSLRKTLQSIFAICAAMKAHIQGIRMGSGYHDGHAIALDPTRFDQQWDKSIQLLDATCSHLQALEIILEHEMPLSDLKWMEKFLLKCSTLEKLSLKNESSSFAYTSLRNPPRHLFFYDIAGTSGTLPPVQELMLQNMDFTPDELVDFVGRFKDTLCSIDLCKINMNGGSGWPEFLGWLQDNIPNLERFSFQGLTHDYSFVGQVVICFDPIFKNQELNVVGLTGAPWQSYAKLSNGALALNLLDESEVSDMEEFFANLEKGKYKLDGSPRENRQVYTAAFEGSNSGAREALRLLMLAAVPRGLDGPLITNPVSINVWEVVVL